MGMTHFTYGASPAVQAKMATNYATGPKPRFPITTIIKRALGADIDTVERVRTARTGISQSCLQATWSVPLRKSHVSG